jgi:phage baseplate assembly protein W
MRRRREEISVNVIDTKVNTAIGVSLPFNGKAVFNSTYTTKDQLKSNIKNYFLTNKGERIFNPEYGADLISLIFEQMPDANTLKEYISDIMSVRFPQVVVNQVLVTTDPDNYKVTIKISYSFRNNEDELNIEINA